MSYQNQLPFVTSLTGIREEVILPGFARTVPESGPNTNYVLPAGFAMLAPEGFIDNSKAVTKVNNQIVSIPRLQGNLVDSEKTEIKEARTWLDEAGRMHPEPSEFCFSARTIPDSVTLLPNEHKLEALGLHQVVNYTRSMNNIGYVMLYNQVAQQANTIATSGMHTNDLNEITAGLWAIYRNETITFQKSKKFFEGDHPDGFASSLVRTGDGSLKIEDDMTRAFPEDPVPGGNHSKKNTLMLLALYIHFLQDPDFDVLKAGYMTWVEGEVEGVRWLEMRAKIMERIKDKLTKPAGVLIVDPDRLKIAEDQANQISSDFIAALAKLEFQLLVGLSADLMKFCVKFTGIAMEHSTEYHDSNPIYADTQNGRDATHLYKVFTVGRHQVFGLAPPMHSRVIKTYYWRPHKYAFFQIFFHPATDTESLKYLIREDRYDNIDDVEVVAGEAIYSDAYEGDQESATLPEKFLWMQAFPHRNYSNLEENVSMVQRRQAYHTERKVSVSMCRSMHK